MSADVPRVHLYDAQAFALEGDLQLPIRQEIKPQAFVDLPASGGYLSQRAFDYRLEGLVSFRSAYTQVAGNRDSKPGRGDVTLATAVLEDFNLLDVITADRVVAQVSTEHPLEGWVPTVTFLGTRFENLQIAGHPVRLEIDENFFGETHDARLAYSKDSPFRNRVAAQHQQICNQPNVPGEISQRYNQIPSNRNPQESIECSLVQRAEGYDPKRSFGHVIDIPHFGRVYLATVRLVETPDKQTGRISTLIRLTMIEAQMGCLANGSTSAGRAVVNGGTQGGG